MQHIYEKVLRYEPVVNTVDAPLCLVRCGEVAESDLSTEDESVSAMESFESYKVALAALQRTRALDALQRTAR